MTQQAPPPIPPSGGAGAPGWLCMVGGRQFGPLNTEVLLTWVAQNRASPDSLVWREGMPHWVMLADSPELRGELVARNLPLAGVPAARGLGDDAGMRMLLPVGRSGLAIAAGYLGLVSLAVWPLGAVALPISIWAIVDLNKNTDKHGMGRAVFGLVCGILGVIATAILAVATILS